MALFSQLLPFQTGFALQRLFSMFPNGVPGAALVLLRIVCSGFVIAGCAKTLFESPGTGWFVFLTLGIAVSLFLLAGLWTPLAGICIVVLETWTGFSRMTGIENAVLLASLGAALAALGPGAHSIDARLYGRRRIKIQQDSKAATPQKR